MSIVKNKLFKCFDLGIKEKKKKNCFDLHNGSTKKELKNYDPT